MTGAATVERPAGSPALRRHTPLSAGQELANGVEMSVVVSFERDNAVVVRGQSMCVRPVGRCDNGIDDTDS
jgi:hypothetical protein